MSIEDLNITFPPDVYSDVRLEHTATADIRYRDDQLIDLQLRSETGAFLRVLKDGRWYTRSTTRLDNLDSQLAELANSNALPPSDLTGIAERLVPHQDQVQQFSDEPINAVPLAEKQTYLEPFRAWKKNADTQTYTVQWKDSRRELRFVSSKGADIWYDMQSAGVGGTFTVAHEGETLFGMYAEGAHRFSELKQNQAKILANFKEKLAKHQRYVRDAQPVTPGVYPVVLSPDVAGVFAHESFGHKSEADLMLGDETALEEWALGRPLGKPFLNIVDDGALLGSGHKPYDDEGQRSRKSYLIRDGKLTGRLHSASTAAQLNEAVTGNARALSFRFDPIVRMTNTYIEAGTQTVEELIAGIDDGFFIETYKHGSGLSTFTIAPSLAWRIRDGALAEPVKVAVLTGNVFETIGDIDGISAKVERNFKIWGGCGKADQWPLPVSFGGPHIRVSRMNVA